MTVRCSVCNLRPCRCDLVACPACGGSGEAWGEVCEECPGLGEVLVDGVSVGWDAGEAALGFVWRDEAKAIERRADDRRAEAEGYEDDHQHWRAIGA